MTATRQRTIRLHPAQGAFRNSAALYRGFVGGIGSGKSFAGAYDLLRRAKPRRLYMVGAPTYVMLRDASLRSFFAIARDLEYLAGFNKNEMTATLGNGAEVLFRSTDDPERLRGPNLSGAWLDEGSLMPRGVFDIMVGRLREAGEQGWLSTTFTPKGRLHWTFDVFGTGQPNTEIFHARTQDNPFLPATFAGTLGGIYAGNFAAQELGGEFVDEDDSFLVIPPKWARAAVGLNLAEAGPVIGGLDIAEEGDNDTVLWTRRGPKVTGRVGWNRCNTTITAYRTVDECRARSVKVLNYDSDGVGTGPKGIWAQMEQVPFQPVPISGGATPSEVYWPDGRTSQDIFHNRRAELWWLLRCRFERTYEFVTQGVQHPPSDLISIPDDKKLLTQLSLPKVEYTDRGKIRIESKDKMRSRGIKSPDEADALVYCFAPEPAWGFAGSTEEDSPTARPPRGAFYEPKQPGGRRDDGQVDYLNMRL